jgi:hypothetical protein
MKMPKVGDSVHYQPKHYQERDIFENGVVKEVRENEPDACWVVYNCGGEWHRIQDYTAAKTQLSDLFPEWR